MRLRCLIVDDNASFREEMRGLLAEQGLEVVGGAGSAADAHRQIAELRPHLILISTHDEAEYADLIEASSAIGFLAKIDMSAATIREMLAAIDGDRADES